MVQFTLARALPTPPGHPSGNVFIPYLGGEQVFWGRIFNIFWQSASSSTLWYNLLWLARFQPHPATPPGMCWSHISGESRSLGAEFLTYSDRARAVLPYGTVYFFRALPTPPSPPYGNVLIPYLRGEQVPWGRIFNIFWQSASSSTLWYNLLWLARFQPHPPTPPGMCWSHIYGESSSLGAEFLTYSDRARPVLPYGTIYFGSRASNPTRPPLRECVDPIFTRTAGPLGPNF